MTAVYPETKPDPMGRPAQVQLMRKELMAALNLVNTEITAAGGEPKIDAVIEAITSIQAEFIAMAPDRNARRMQMAEIEKALPRLIALRTGH